MGLIRALIHDMLDGGGVGEGTLGDDAPTDIL